MLRPASSDRVRGTDGVSHHDDRSVGNFVLVGALATQQSLQPAVNVGQLTSALAEVLVVDRVELARELGDDLLERPARRDPADANALGRFGDQARILEHEFLGLEDSGIALARAPP